MNAPERCITGAAVTGKVPESTENQNVPAAHLKRQPAAAQLCR